MTAEQAAAALAKEQEQARREGGWDRLLTDTLRGLLVREGYTPAQARLAHVRVVGMTSAARARRKAGW